MLDKRSARSELRLGAAKRLIPHEQRRKRIGFASSELGNFAFHPHARLPRHEQVASHIRPTNEPWKKTHPLNFELIATQMEYGKLQQRTDLGLDGQSKDR